MKQLLYFILLFSTPLAYAGLRPMVVQTQNQAPDTLIFVRNHETNQQAFERYSLSVAQNPNLKEVSGIEASMVRQYSEFQTTKDTIAVVANNSKDFSGEAQRMRNLKTLMQDSKTQVIQLPVGLLSPYSPQERIEIKNWINRFVKTLIVPGGDDVDARFYSEKNIYSRNTNPERDQLEAEIVKSYMDYKKGFVLGICRGHQLISALLGYKLIQDIPLQTGQEVKHADDWHSIKIKPTHANTLANFLKLPPNSSIQVNSLHHQSVIFASGGPLELAATSLDKTTEALEFKNGHGLTLQFHPEYMNNKTGEQILSGVKSLSNHLWKSCKSQFR